MIFCDMARSQNRTLSHFDPTAPLDALHVERVEREAIDIVYGEVAPGQNVIRVVHEKLVLSPAAARWLRDVLAALDLQD